MNRPHRLRFISASAVVVSLLAGAFLTASYGEDGNVRVLDAKRYMLGALGKREWDIFEGRRPDGRGLEIKFTASVNASDITLFVRHNDVKLNWPVMLNGARLGKLELFEGKSVTTLTVPASLLRDGENVLSIQPPGGIDDIEVGEILLDKRPPAQALGETTLEITVQDEETGTPLPCRLTIVDEEGAFVPLISLTPDKTAARAGVVYTADGQAKISMAARRCTVYATRGMEYSLARQEVTMGLGDTKAVKLQLKREVPTPGLVACDTHIHTFEFSKHGDATAAERAITLAGEGIELPVATDHNLYADFSVGARQAGVQDYFTLVPGIEVTTKVGHFNAFPVSRFDAPLPNFKLENWPEIQASIRSIPGIQIVILNHPRDAHNKFIPFNPERFNPVTGDNALGGDFTFDAMELVNSGAMQSDFMQNYRDWFALLNRGYRLTGVGSSDCHDVSRFIVGQGRTYIACADQNPGKLDAAAACRNFKAGRAYVSLGLLTLMKVEQRFEAGDLASISGDKVAVEVRVLGPAWTQAESVALYQNGVKVREQKIDSLNKAGEKVVVRWELPRPAHDGYLVAVAHGPGVTENYWKQSPPYQPTTPLSTMPVIGSTNPVWLDADGDGKYTSPRAHAEARLKSVANNNDPAAIISALKDSDAAVASQAAELLVRCNIDIRSPAFQSTLTQASSDIRKGIEAYIATMTP